jgi:hypothetical protein
MQNLLFGRKPGIQGQVRINRISDFRFHQRVSAFSSQEKSAIAGPHYTTRVMQRGRTIEAPCGSG